MKTGMYIVLSIFITTYEYVCHSTNLHEKHTPERAMGSTIVGNSPMASGSSSPSKAGKWAVIHFACSLIRVHTYIHTYKYICKNNNIYDFNRLYATGFHVSFTVLKP